LFGSSEENKSLFPPAQLTMECLYLIFPLVILFTGTVTMLETPEDIMDREEDNRGWIS
jgi:hypothetical protein